MALTGGIISAGFADDAKRLSSAGADGAFGDDLALPVDAAVCDAAADECVAGNDNAALLIAPPLLTLPLKVV